MENQHEMLRVKEEVAIAKQLIEDTAQYNGSAKSLAYWIKVKKGVRGFSASNITNILNGSIDNIEKIKELQDFCKDERYLTYLKTGAYKNEDIKKIDLYLNRTFYLYYIDTRRSSKQNFIGRSVLKIGENENDVKISDVGTVISTSYEGDISIPKKNENHIILQMRTSTLHVKDLKIIFRISTDKKTPYMIGGYMNIGEYNDVVMGALIAEEYQDKKEEPTALFITPKTKDYQNLNPYIKSFFRRKEKNYMKVPMIYSDEEFKDFFDEQERKRKTEPLPNTVGTGKIFISCPMASIKEDSQTNLRDLVDTVKKIKTYLKNKFDCEVYSASDNIDTESSEQITFITAPAHVEGILEELYTSDKFLMIYPENLSSSCLMELGWALAERKSCVVYYQRDITMLPYTLQHLPRIQKFSYSDNHDLYKQIQGIGNYLFQ